MVDVEKIKKHAERGYFAEYRGDNDMHECESAARDVLALLAEVERLEREAAAGRELREAVVAYRAQYMKWTGMEDTEAMKAALAEYDKAVANEG